MDNPASKNEYHDDRMKKATKALYALSVASRNGIYGVAHMDEKESQPHPTLSSLDACMECLVDVLARGDGDPDNMSDLDLVAWEVLVWFNIPRINRMASNPK